MLAGGRWGALLIGYFAVSALLSRIGAREKALRTGTVVAKGGARDWRQVLANGGVFAACLLLAPGTASLWATAALGAIAASAADTWATEIGTLLGGTPLSLRTFTRIETGTSGGVSVAGTLAMGLGATAIAIGAASLGVPVNLRAVIVGGIAGAAADTVLGATLQERRWCSQCRRYTERRVHGCGTTTSVAEGVAGVENDAVNLSATIVGAAVAALLSRG